MSPLPPVSVAVRLTYSIQDWTQYSWPQPPPGIYYRAIRSIGLDAKFTVCFLIHYVRLRISYPGFTDWRCRTSLVKQAFLLLFMFLISSILHHHPALLHHHALILGRLLTLLMVFTTLVLKLSFSQSFSFHSHLSFLRPISLNYDHSLFGSHWRW